MEGLKQESENFKTKWADKIKKAKEKGQKAPVLESQLKTAFRNSVPVFILLATAYIYIFTVHPLFKSCKYDYERTLVYFLSLCIVKSGGEKILKYTLEKNGLPDFGADLTLFIYELVMSMQARLLLLSMPSATSLFLASAVTAIWEFALRMFFVLKHIRDGKKFKNFTEKKLFKTKEEFNKKYKEHKRKAFVLTSNTCGDMVVEYVGANAAMAIYVSFSGMKDAFRFASFGGENVELTFTMVVLSPLAQHVPELVCDFIAMWYESRAGLKVKEYFYKQMSIRYILPKLVVTLYCVFVVLFTMRKYY